MSRRWKALVFAGLACTICIFAYLNMARDSLNWIREHGGQETQRTIYSGTELTPIAKRHAFRFDNLPIELVGEIKAKSSYGDGANEGGALVGGMNISVDSAAKTVTVLRKLSFLERLAARLWGDVPHPTAAQDEVTVELEGFEERM
jgi:hypothetical protein